MRKVHSKQTIRKLHIGGKISHPEWEILSTVNANYVDHHCNAKNLSQFNDNTFNEIYASHVLEHFDYKDEIIEVLNEWIRVLIPSGKLYVSVPDMDILCELFIRKDLDIVEKFHVMRMIFGGHIDEHDYHMMRYYKEILEIYLREAKFININFVKDFGIFNDTSSMKLKDKLISLNVVAEKKNK